MIESIKRNIPNVITSMNLFSGCCAIVFAFKGELQIAAGFIFAAAIFDFFDGFVARLLKVSSPLGVQLDSLADVVSFGVAPSAILFYLMNFYNTALDVGMPRIVCYSAFLIAVFSALRLAKFNIDDRQTESFIGLPTPACALFICGIAFLHHPVSFGFFCSILAGTVPLMCFLLISELPMFSLKIKPRRKGQTIIKQYLLQIILVIGAIVFIAIFDLAGISWTIILFIILSVINMFLPK